MRAIALVAAALLLAGFIDVPSARAAEPCADVPGGTPIHDVCIVVEPAIPPAGGNISQEPCGLFVIVVVSDGSASVCIGILVNGTLTPPDVVVEPPGDPGDVDADIEQISCGFAGSGYHIFIGDSDVLVCIDYQIGGGGALFGLDISGCPGGTDPRLDLAGFFVAVCVIADGKIVPPFGPGVEVPPTGEVVPEVDLTPCPGGLDPAVRWMGLNVTVCATTDIDLPSAPDIDTEECGPGEEGLFILVGGTRVGACAS